MEHKKEREVTKYVLLHIYYYKYKHYDNSITMTILQYYYNTFYTHSSLSTNDKKDSLLEDQRVSLLMPLKGSLIKGQQGPLLKDQGSLLLKDKIDLLLQHQKSHRSSSIKKP